MKRQFHTATATATATVEAGGAGNLHVDVDHDPLASGDNAHGAGHHAAKRVAYQDSQMVFDPHTGRLVRTPTAFRPTLDRSEHVSNGSSSGPAIECASCLFASDPDRLDLCTRCHSTVCDYCSVRRSATVCLNCI